MPLKKIIKKIFCFEPFTGKIRLNRGTIWDKIFKECVVIEWVNLKNFWNRTKEFWNVL